MLVLKHRKPDAVAITMGPSYGSNSYEQKYNKGAKLDPLTNRPLPAGDKYMQEHMQQQQRQVPSVVNVRPFSQSVSPSRMSRSSRPSSTRPSRPASTNPLPALKSLASMPAELRRAFDKDGDGTVDDDQHSEVQMVMESFDANKDGHIDWKEHGTMLERMMRFDHNNDGKISYEEFQRGCMLFGKNMSKEKMKKMFQRIDTDKSGFIELPEFITSDVWQWGPADEVSRAARKRRGHIHENRGDERMHGTDQDRQNFASAERQKMHANLAVSQDLAVLMAKAKLQGNTHATGQQLVKAFQFFDTDRNGTLNKAEIIAAVKALKIPASSATIGGLVDSFGGGESEVDYMQFVKSFLGSTWRQGIYRPVGA